MKTSLLRMAKPVLYAVYLVFASTFLFFTLLEFAPGLARSINLQPIRYYAQWQQYRPDDTLVFVPTWAAEGHPTTQHAEFPGDLYSPEYGIPYAAANYNASYTSDGFRSNSSTSDFKVLVIGDSYVEIGEDDSLTLSEQLKQVSTKTTFNLGRAWYGPFQYLELLKRYAATVRPRYAVLCFFDGNDTEDTKQFLKWQRGRSYYSFVLSTKSFMGRYFTAFRDTYHYLFDRIGVLLKSLASPPPPVSQPKTMEAAAPSAQSDPNRMPPDLGLIDIGGQPVPMRFMYWNAPKPTEELLSAEEWKAVGQFLKEYERLAAQYGIVPIIVFVPTKIEVYGAQYVAESSPVFVEKIKTQLQFENNSHEAFLRLVKETKLRLVDLLPAFKNQARAGKLLYYPFDSHWNVEGRRIAAEEISTALVE